MAEETETKRYLDYDGLKYLVEKLTNRIEASGGGGSPWVPEPGAYVAYTDADGVNRIARPSEYKSEGNTPCGVLVVHGGGSLLVGKYEKGDNENTKWGSSVCLVDTGGFLTTNMNYALNDMDGKRNTELATEIQLGDTSIDWDEDGWQFAFYLLHSESLGGNIGPRAGWMASLGEMRVIHDYFDEVVECVSALGGGFTDYWDCFQTSTQYSESHIWAYDLRNNLIRTAGKSGTSMPFIAVSRFAWVPDGYSGGGEPSVAREPISVEPSTVYQNENPGTATWTVQVTSATAWRLVTEIDNEGIKVSPTEGAAGTTEVTVTHDNESGMGWQTLVFEDEDGNTAELRRETYSD